MTKQIRNTFFVLALSFSMAFAQTAPDFTVTDIDGVEHQLYADYLEQGKTVVLDFFFADCPPCDAIAPYLQDLYFEWGEGEGDVEFIAITGDPYGVDNDIKVRIFHIQHGITYPSISNQGGAEMAIAPYLDDQFGFFEGYPTFAVISPDGTVQFDVGLGGNPAGIPSIENAIIESGARHPSEITDIATPTAMFDKLMVSPNPANDFTTLNFNLNTAADLNIQVLNLMGQHILDVFQGNKYPGEHQLQVPTEQLPAGTYFVRINANEAVQTLRFVKQ